MQIRLYIFLCSFSYTLQSELISESYRLCWELQAGGPWDLQPCCPSTHPAFQGGDTALGRLKPQHHRSQNPRVSAAPPAPAREHLPGQYSTRGAGCVPQRDVFWTQSSPQCPHDINAEGSHAPGSGTNRHVSLPVLCSHLWPLGLTAV